MKISSYTVTLLSVFLVLAACGGGGGGSDTNGTPPVIDPDTESKALLVPVVNDTQLLASVKNGFSNITDSTRLDAPLAVQELDASASSDPNSSSTGFTTTYIQEASIDEHDAVKYDGNHIFIAPSRGMSCCFIFDDIALMDEADEPAQADAPIMPLQEERAIRVVATNPEDATATEVGSIAVDESYSVEGLYAHGDQLAAISTSGWWGGYGEQFATVSNWQGQTTVLDIYDISDVTSPSSQMRIEFQGGFVDSRKKGDTIFLVARHTPDLDGFNYFPAASDTAQNDTLLDNLAIEDILPRVTVNNNESLLVEASDCLITDKNNELAPQQTGHPTLTLLIAINLTDQAIANTACYLEPTNGIYVSEQAIYLAQIDYNNFNARTLIHSYELSESLTYQGSGVADGSLYLSGNNDFRINEHEGYLRLVTTEYNSNLDDWIDHKLSVLKLNPQDLKLELVATLPNNERPQAIGKPNEELYGARFFGDKVYLVTFERIDPLYVLDLSTPTDPIIAGELEVTGFSDFLHPINDQLLMGLGEDENGFTKLELFNVETINSPYSLGTVILGLEDDTISLDSLNWSYSEARYNRHAFTYQVISDTQDRFLVPANLSFYSEDSGYQYEDRLYLFEINNKNTAGTASIDQVGHIAVEHDVWLDSRHRGIIHNDSVFFINGSSVWSTLWSNSTEQNGPQ